MPTLWQRNYGQPRPIRAAAHPALTVYASNRDDRARVLAPILLTAGPMPPIAQEPERKGRLRLGTWRSRIALALFTAIVWCGYERFDSVVRAVALELGVWYAPADSTLWRVDGYAGDDPIHLNDEGALRMARHLARVVHRGPRLGREPRRG